MKPREEWVKMFDEIDDDGRRYVLAVLRGEFERTRTLPRARLRLINCANVASSLPKGQVNPLPIGGAG